MANVGENISFPWGLSHNNMHIDSIQMGCVAEKTSIPNFWSTPKKLFRHPFCGYQFQVKERESGKAT